MTIDTISAQSRIRTKHASGSIYDGGIGSWDEEEEKWIWGGGAYETAFAYLVGAWWATTLAQADAVPWNDWTSWGTSKKGYYVYCAWGYYWSTSVAGSCTGHAIANKYCCEFQYRIAEPPAGWKIHDVVVTEWYENWVGKPASTDFHQGAQDPGDYDYGASESTNNPSGGSGWEIPPSPPQSANYYGAWYTFNYPTATEQLKITVNVILTSGVEMETDDPTDLSKSRCTANGENIGPIAATASFEWETYDDDMNLLDSGETDGQAGITSTYSDILTYNPTDYYVRYRAKGVAEGYDTDYGEWVGFNVADQPAAITVVTDAPGWTGAVTTYSPPRHIDKTWAEVRGELTSVDADIPSIGIYLGFDFWKVSTAKCEVWWNPPGGLTKVYSPQAFSCGLAPLQPNTDYTYQAKARLEKGAGSTILNGTMTVNVDYGSYIRCYFEWGETDAYGNTTWYVHTTESTDFHVPITGLTVGQTYHYRAVAESSEGTFYGADTEFQADGTHYGVEQTFTTLDIPEPIFGEGEGYNYFTAKQGIEHICQHTSGKGYTNNEGNFIYSRPA